MSKMLAVGFGVTTVILAVMLIHAHRAQAGQPVTKSGAVIPDARGTKDLAAKQIVMGSKAVAEASKEATLGTIRADDRATEKKRRVG
jgi:hypothetical protein